MSLSLSAAVTHTSRSDKAGDCGDCGCHALTRPPFLTRAAGRGDILGCNVISVTQFTPLPGYCWKPRPTRTGKFKDNVEEKTMGGGCAEAGGRWMLHSKITAGHLEFLCFHASPRQYSDVTRTLTGARPFLVGASPLVAVATEPENQKDGVGLRETDSSE